VTTSPTGPPAGPFSELLDRFLGMSPAASPPAVQRVPMGRLLSEAGRELIGRASERAAGVGSGELGTEHLLWAATRVEPSRGLLREAGTDPDELAEALPREGRPAPAPGLTPGAKRALLGAHTRSREAGDSHIGPEHILAALLAGQGPARPPRDTPTLDRYGRDLTEEARAGRLDPVVGRAGEIEQLAEVLSRRTRNNPALIGEPGVGKSAIVAGLAQRIAGGDVPEALRGWRVVALDVAGLAGERLRDVVDEAAGAEPPVVLFVDGRDVGSLRPALVRGEPRVVATTTGVAGWDAALERCFQPMTVDEPGVTETVRILAGLRDAYEAHHQVRFADDALTAAAELADRYVTGGFLPQKAIDLIDQAGARARLAERRDVVREVTAADVAEVVSYRTGIPVTQLTESEKERLLKLEHALRERVVGQDEAVTAVAEVVRRSRAGLGDPDLPVGSFLFLGPTGVGKTELAKALAGQLFGDERRLVRREMGESQERESVSRLMDRVRRQPYSVLLFDGIEKAHPDVLHALRQVLGEGRLTDGQGRTVSFRSTVVVMTSDVGAHRGDAGEGREEMVEGMMKDLGVRVPPELRERIDETVVFHRLGPAELDRVVDLMLERSRRRVREQGMSLAVSGAARRLLAEHGHRPEYGARRLRRTIQRELDNRIAALLLSDGVRVGDTITADVRDGELVCAISGAGQVDDTERAQADAEAEGWPPAA
jgi:ATP-dependent Clp protease ATP-binding subunit ClpC